MAEFVIDATDAQLGDAFDARAFFGPRLREEIVRCRDCSMFVMGEPPGEYGCTFFDFFMDNDCGFCKWAERRTDG